MSTKSKIDRLFEAFDQAGQLISVAELLGVRVGKLSSVNSAQATVLKGAVHKMIDAFFEAHENRDSLDSIRKLENANGLLRRVIDRTEIQLRPLTPLPRGKSVKPKKEQSAV